MTEHTGRATMGITGMRRAGRAEPRRATGRERRGRSRTAPSRTVLPALAVLLVLAAVLAAGCRPGEADLEVRTFTLQSLDAGEAETLVAPYVYRGRERAPGMSTTGTGVLTVRELPENLDRIAAVLERYDSAPRQITLRFHLVEADGFEGADPEIAEVEEELRRVLRYDGYRVVASPVVRLREGASAEQTFRVPHEGGWGTDAALLVRVGYAQPADGGAERIPLEVRLDGPPQVELVTDVTIRDGQTAVLGTTGQISADGEAVILVVRPTVEGG